VAVELLAHLLERSRPHPRLERRADHLACDEAAALVVEVHVHQLRDLGEGLAQVASPAFGRPSDAAMSS